MPAMQDNLNAVAKMLAPSCCTDERVAKVYKAINDLAIDWPEYALHVLNVPGLHDNVLVILTEIAAQVGDGRPVKPYQLKSLENRVRRYHPGQAGS